MQNILDFGAISDEHIASTCAVQKAVDACATNGGGTVYVPAGTYTVATIKLYSNVHFVFEAGAKFLGSLNPDDFEKREELNYPLYQDSSHSYVRHSMFYAEDCDNISFSGFGTIDMREVWESKCIKNEIEWCNKRAAKIFGIKKCTNVSICDLTLKRATDVAVYLAGCENVKIRGLNIDTNIDGISPDCCKNVAISDCIIKSGDDAIVLKSSYILNKKQLCENIVISSCILSSRCNAIKLGTESIGGFRTISISNCSIYNTYYSGVALEITDGGELNGITIENISMKNVGYPLFIILSNRCRAPDGTKIGSVENIVINNITATGPYLSWKGSTMTALFKGDQTTEPQVLPSTITGHPNKKIKNISMSNIYITVPGGNVIEKEIILPEITSEYPENAAFGTEFPTYGMFFRHIDNLMLSNIKIDTMKEDCRKPIVYDDVTEIRTFNMDMI